MSHGLGETVTVHTRSVTDVDVFGNDVVSWTDTVIRGVAVWPIGAASLVQGELTSGEDLVTGGLQALLPGSTVIGPLDEMTVRGLRYAVDGAPRGFRNPMTGRRSILAVLTTNAISPVDDGSDPSGYGLGVYGAGTYGA